MRGTDARHHIHGTEPGEPAFVGFAYRVESAVELEAIAALAGAGAIDEPGGGRRVRLREPNGFQVEIVHRIEDLAPISSPRQSINIGAQPLAHAGEPLRLPASPSPVKRIGHGVLATPEVVATTAWFRETLGMLRSDDVYAGAEDNIVGAFRCKRRSNTGPLMRLGCLAAGGKKIRHLIAFHHIDERRGDVLSGLYRKVRLACRRGGFRVARSQ